jgi:hypothetical protein
LSRKCNIKRRSLHPIRVFDEGKLYRLGGIHRLLGRGYLAIGQIEHLASLVAHNLSEYAQIVAKAVPRERSIPLLSKTALD